MKKNLYIVLAIVAMAILILFDRFYSPKINPKKMEQQKIVPVILPTGQDSAKNGYRQKG